MSSIADKIRFISIPPKVYGNLLSAARTAAGGAGGTAAAATAGTKPTVAALRMKGRLLRIFCSQTIVAHLHLRPSALRTWLLPGLPLALLLVTGTMRLLLF